MREYFMFYYAWGNACKVPTVLGRLLTSNIKRQMDIEEGLLFIRLMKRTHNLTCKTKHGHYPFYKKEKKT